MATFVMLGKYSLTSVKGISEERTDKAAAVIKKNGGKLRDGYIMLGETDLVLIVELPNAEQAMKTSVALTELTGISFTTAPAVTLKEFDKLMK